MKVAIGRQSTGKKYNHDLSFDVSTTSDYGFMQPFLCYECAAKDSVNLNFAQIVRLNPMPKPTFGQFFLKTYTSFVKIEDIYHPFASLLNGQVYTGAYASYIPETVPTISHAALNAILHMFSDVYFFQIDSPSITTPGDLRFSGLVEVPYTIENDWYNSEFLAQMRTRYDVWDDDFFAKMSLALQEACGGLDAPDSFPHWRQSDLDTSDLDTTLAGIQNFDWYMFLPHFGTATQEEVDVPVLVCGRFMNFARNLRKILYGLGYKQNWSETQVSFLPLVAYYKCYFDLFVPQRDITWKDTPAFSIMEYLEQTGLSRVQDLISVNPQPEYHLLTRLARFFVDLALSYYTIDPDYASAHIVGTSTDVATQSSPIFNFLSATGSDVSVETDVYQQPMFEANARNLITPSGLRILEQMTKLINRRTVYGGNLAQAMRAEYNSEYSDEVDSEFIGAQTVSCSPDPVMNTAETDQGSLGEFAGQCIGSSRSPGNKEVGLHFTAKAPGFVISMFTLVPESRMCQGVNPQLYHKERADFFKDEFDAITLLPTRKAAIYGIEEFSFSETQSQQYDQGFGNIPNQTEDKVKQNLMNGDMTLGSTRASYLPFNVDKILPFTEFYKSVMGGIEMHALPADLLVAGTFWRFIGRDRWFGQFNRVFYNENAEGTEASYNTFLRRYDDNFIVQMYVDFKLNSYKLPLSLSFDTGAFDDDIMEVQKS